MAQGRAFLVAPGRRGKVDLGGLRGRLASGGARSPAGGQGGELSRRRPGRQSAEERLILLVGADGWTGRATLDSGVAQLGDPCGQTLTSPRGGCVGEPRLAPGTRPSIGAAPFGAGCAGSHVGGGCGRAAGTVRGRLAADEVGVRGQDSLVGLDQGLRPGREAQLSFCVQPPRRRPLKVGLVTTKQGCRCPGPRPSTPGRSPDARSAGGSLSELNGTRRSSRAHRGGVFFDPASQLHVQLGEVPGTYAEQDAVARPDRV